MTFDNLDFEGDDEKNVLSAAFSNDERFAKDEDEVFTDGSVDVDDCMALFSTQSHKVVPKFEETKPIIKTAKEATKEKERYSHRNSKKKSKAMPIRGRRMKTMASK